MVTAKTLELSKRVKATGLRARVQERVYTWGVQPEVVCANGDVAKMLASVLGPCTSGFSGAYYFVSPFDYQTRT